VAERANPAPVRVVAAIIRWDGQRDGRILICQRRRDDAFPLKWEFPGGKIAPGESCEEALRRELREELGVEARVGAECFRTHHHYTEQNRSVELLFFPAVLESRDVKNLAFEQIVWAEPADLVKYDFLEADREVVAALAARRLPGA
jgi:ADP-ribose pyrophosphatase